jgi:hypothetical protein
MYTRQGHENYRGRLWLMGRGSHTTYLVVGQCTGPSFLEPTVQ